MNEMNDRGSARNEGISADSSVSEQAPSASAMTADPTQRIAELEQEIAALKDRNLRAVAEMQNLQRRAQREKEEALRFAESEFAKQLLTVLDGLERAQEAAKDATDPRPVADGVRIVYEQFLKILKDHKIEPIDAVGQAFDPDLHEALMHRSSADVSPGEVIEQFARGYRMHGRVLRPAKVVVARSA
jgi:molecular chaperone GrpE